MSIRTRSNGSSDLVAAGRTRTGRAGTTAFRRSLAWCFFFCSLSLSWFAPASLGAFAESRARAAESDATGAAAAKGRPIVPPPPAELKALDYFRGTWICTGVTEPKGAAPAHLTDGKTTYKWDLANFFQTFTRQDKRTKEDPTPRLERGYLGYDPETKEFNLDLFAVGGARLVANAPGPMAGTLSFAGEFMAEGKRVKATYVITRKSDTEYGTVMESAGSAGQTTKLFHEKCVRSGK